MAYYVAVGIGAYAALSLSLFCFPNVIHRRKKYQSEIIEEALHNPSRKALLVAHRGGKVSSYFPSKIPLGAREAPENTVEAFQYAVIFEHLECYLTRSRSRKELIYWKWTCI